MYQSHLNMKVDCHISKLVYYAGIKAYVIELQFGQLLHYNFIPVPSESDQSRNNGHEQWKCNTDRYCANLYSGWTNLQCIFIYLLVSWFVAVRSCNCFRLIVNIAYDRVVFIFAGIQHGDVWCMNQVNKTSNLRKADFWISTTQSATRTNAYKKNILMVSLLRVGLNIGI